MSELRGAKPVKSRIYLNLLLAPQLRLSSKLLQSRKSREQGFSLAVILISMLSVLLASVAIANRTQAGSLTASLSGNNRVAREVAESGITYIVSEWNRPENRGVMRALQPMGTWQPSNLNLQNPCSAEAPTASGTSGLNNGQEIIVDANRKFRLARVTFFGSDSTQVFQTTPGSTTLPSPSFEPTAIELVVEGTYQRGNLETKATATKRLKLEAACTQAGLFVFGGTNPGLTSISLGSPPSYYYQGTNSILSKSSQVIECLPLATGTTSTQCPPTTTTTRTNTVLVVRTVNLLPVDKLRREPPQIETIADEFKVSAPSPFEINKSTKGNVVINETWINRAGRPHCIRSPKDNSAHCRISMIETSNTLTVDTTVSPVYLYVEGNIDFRGNLSLFHVNGNSSTGEVSPNGYKDINSYQEDVFRFQIRGGKSGTTERLYTFKGNPTSNLLFWAPASTLELKGNTTFSSALFVNKVIASNNTNIILSNVPGSFISAFKNNLVGTSQSSTAQGTVYTKFY